MIKFLAAGLRSLHRGSHQCKIPLSQELKPIAQKFFDDLSNYSTLLPECPTNINRSKPNDPDAANEPPVPESLLSSLQDFFFSSVTGIIKTPHDNKFTCPVQVYIACFGYKRDDTFKTAPELTSLLANWQYLLRCTALYQAHKLFEANAVGSVFE